MEEWRTQGWWEGELASSVLGDRASDYQLFPQVGKMLRQEISLGSLYLAAVCWKKAAALCRLTIVKLCKSLGSTDLVIVSSSGQVTQEELHMLSTGVISYVCTINLTTPPDVF